MQLFGSLGFWCAVLGLFAAGHLLPANQVRLRAGAIAAISAAGIVLFFALQVSQLALLAASIAWIVTTLSVIKPNPRAATIRTALLLIAPILAFWTIGKLETAAQQPLGWLFFAGSSFFLVKAFSLIKDRLEGKVREFDPVLGVAYFIYVPTYISGPMHTYGEFRDTIARPEPMGSEFVDVAFRFVWGMFKVTVLAAILDRSSLTQLVSAARIPVGQLVPAALVYSFVLYFNFSGYTDMVIALSRFLGIRTPENFDWPYLSPSIRDFWRRWHITFTRALTAHVFIPVSRALSRTPIGRNRFATPFFGYFVTFLFAGFWHGGTVNFLLWGAWHASGLVAQDFQQKLRKPQVGVTPPPPLAQWSIRAVNTAGTFLFVSLGWIFFVLPVGQLGRLTWTLR